MGHCIWRKWGGPEVQQHCGSHYANASVCWSYECCLCWCDDNIIYKPGGTVAGWQSGWETAGSGCCCFLPPCRTKFTIDVDFVAVAASAAQCSLMRTNRRLQQWQPYTDTRTSRISPQSQSESKSERSTRVAVEIQNTRAAQTQQLLWYVCTFS